MPTLSEGTLKGEREGRMAKSSNEEMTNAHTRQALVRVNDKFVIDLLSGHIRRVRIVLLRATHLPFVALIWAFESSRRYVSQRNNQFPPTQATSTSFIQANFPFSTHHASLHTSAVGSSQLGCGNSKGSNNAAQHAEAREDCGLTPNQAGRNDLAGMIDEMERLRTQVERVAATIAFHQRNRL
ncbi:hypothetical protein ACP6JD_005151 [Aspergillus fumigatus]